MTLYLFDAYGTVLDLSPSLKPAEAKLGDKAAAVLARWRQLQLDYAWQSALRGAYEPFDAMTRSAFADALSEVGIADTALVAELMRAFERAPAYSDIAPLLTNLQEAGHKTAILSNGTPAMLETAIAASGLSALFDALLSVDVVQTYKPAPPAYAVGTKAFGVPADDVVFVSSNTWDVIGARAFGFHAVWLNRAGGVWPPSSPEPEAILPSAAALVDFQIS